MLVAPTPRFIFDDKRIKKDLDNFNADDSLDGSSNSMSKEDNMSNNLRDVAEDNDVHTFVEVENYSNGSTESEAGSSRHKEKDGDSVDNLHKEINMGVMPIASSSKKNSKTSPNSECVNGIEMKLRKFTDKMEEFILKLQTPSFKCLIVCCYIALIASSMMNTIFCTSMQVAWAYLGGPTMIFGMLTMSVSSATLVWYLAKPEPLHGFEDMPYVLSISAWSEKLGSTDHMIQVIMCYGWVALGIKQIHFMITANNSQNSTVKPLSVLTVFSFLGILASLVPITGVKILEYNVVRMKRKLLDKELEV